MSDTLVAPSVVAQTTNKSIQLNHRALTVNLSISQWTARKRDDKATRQVEEENKAQHGAGNFNKLLIGKDALKDVQAAVSKIRTFHYFNTMPWNDNGERLLAATNLIPYTKELNELRKEFDQAVRDFVSSYPQYIDDARGRLGKLFNINDYPSEREIAGKFGVKPIILNIPDSDFRVGGLGTEELKQLKSAAELEIQERLNNAIKDVWDRIATQLRNMKEKLSDKDAIFRNSLFGNLQELVEVLPRMNIMGDAKLAKITNQMRDLVVDPDTVRCDQTLRSIKAQEVEAIMDQYKDFF